MGTRVLIVLLCLLCWAGASWAQPAPDDAYLSVTLATPAGNALPLTAQTTAVLFTDTPTRARAGAGFADVVGQRIFLSGLKPGSYVLVVTDGARQATVEQKVTLREGINDLAVRLPLAQLALQFTLNGTPVTPTQVQAYLKPPQPTGLPLMPVPKLPGAAWRLDGLPTIETQLLVLTDVGTALAKVTASTAPNAPPAVMALTPGGMADITATDTAGIVLADLPIICTLPDGGLIQLTSDAAGMVKGIQLPVGRATVQIPWQWLAQHREYRSAWFNLLVKAGTPATLAFKVNRRQSAAFSFTVNNAPVMPEQCVFLLWQPAATPTWIEQTPTRQPTRLVLESFFPVANRAWFFTDRGYASLDFNLPLEQNTLEQTVPLKTDGSSIELTVQTTPATPPGPYRYYVTGKLAGLTGTDVAAFVNLTAVDATHYRSPQLPPGTWIVAITGPKSAQQAVAVTPGTVTKVTLAL